MLPAVPTLAGVGAAGRPMLADVLPSMLSSIRGDAAKGPLDLPPASRAVVVLVDGMGTQPLLARAGHARTLAPLITRRSTIHAGFPTTTASALATLATGTLPGEHGLVGYSVLDAANDRVVNQLNGWDARLDPLTWQRSPTMFERATDAGIPSFVVGTERYRESGFTRAILRGAAYRSGATIADRIAVVRDLFDRNARALVYLYIPELDKAGHAFGSESPEWTAVLEEVDGAIGGLRRSLRPDEGALVTADHGMLDIPEHGHILFDQDPTLLEGLRFVAGEPRCLQLHLEADASPGVRAAALERWRTAEAGRAWVISRAEAIAAGWFGEVAAEVRPRIGDILVAARKPVAYYDSRITVRSGRSMIGQHGSLTAAETSVPLLRLGAYATA